jgi:hypothetical protein
VDCDDESFEEYLVILVGTEVVLFAFALVLGGLEIEILSKLNVK